MILLFYYENEKIDFGKMIENTADAIKRGVENICETSFSHDGLYCAVDILRKEKDSYAIYEVKSSTEPKYIYIVDISYQKYVLEKCGVKVTGTYVVNIDSDYLFDVYKLSFPKQLELYKRGITELKDVKANAKLNALQRQQIDFILEDKPPHADKEGIKSFLDGLSYPLYFLDFETMQLVIPEYPNSHPYQQITFQYSLHYIESENGVLKHKEFLGVSGEDPRRTLAQQLCADIPEDACVLAYNRGFERGRIKELSNLFPDLADKLMHIHANIQDLIDPFHHGHYYTKAIGNSFSIKSVLPAMFPDAPELDYHNLEGVHNGGEAMNLFPLIKDMPPCRARNCP